MKGLIVINGFRTLKAVDYKIKRLKEEFLKKGIDVDYVSALDLKAYFKDGQAMIGGIDQYSFCIYLDKDYSMASLLEKKLPLFNSAQAMNDCNDKMTTFLKLSGSGIKMPKTIPAPLCYRQEEASDEKIERYVDYIISEFGFPLICKNCFGSLGLQVYLIKNKEELISKYKELVMVPHLYQQYISSSCGRDFRIFTIGGKAVAYMERINDHDFRSNIALGGKGYHNLPPEGFISTAEKASQLLQLDYAGVDILIGPDQTPYLSEVNSNAFFTEIEEVSKVNVTALLVDHIIQKLRK
jgi:gamma-F420-2:alpha-L-glutamate ligase